MSEGFRAINDQVGRLPTCRGAAAITELVALTLSAPIDPPVPGRARRPTARTCCAALDSLPVAAAAG